MASIIFAQSYDSIGKGEKRTLGKIAELALGYGQGARKFGDTARTIGRVDLDALGVDAAGVVEVWRRAHAPIVRFWRACEAGWRAALEGRARRVAGFDFCPGRRGRDRRVPSVGAPAGLPGSARRPRRARAELPRHRRDPKALVPMCPRHFARVHGVDRKRGTGTCEHCGEVAFEWRTHVYGGKLAENLIQALCRDLLSDALVRVEAAGLGPVMHVHDEIVCEVRAGEEADAYESLCAAMLDVPSWAKGFPAGAAGWTGRRYRK
jgi:DNA polymerase